MSWWSSLTMTSTPSIDSTWSGPGRLGVNWMDELGNRELIRRTKIRATMPTVRTTVTPTVNRTPVAPGRGPDVGADGAAVDGVAYATTGVPGTSSVAGPGPAGAPAAGVTSAS